MILFIRYGFDVFVQAYPGLNVYAHKSLHEYFQQLVNVRDMITLTRAVHQYGTELDEDEYEHSGIGRELR